MLACGGSSLDRPEASGMPERQGLRVENSQSACQINNVNRKMSFVGKHAKRSTSLQYCSRDSGVYSSGGYDVEGPPVVLRSRLTTIARHDDAVNRTFSGASSTQSSLLYSICDSGASSSLIQYDIQHPTTSGNMPAADSMNLTKMNDSECDAQVPSLASSTNTDLYNTSQDESLHHFQENSTDDVNDEQLESLYSASNLTATDDINALDRRHLMVTCEEELSVIMDSCCTISSHSTSSCIISSSQQQQQHYGSSMTAYSSHSSTRVNADRMPSSPQVPQASSHMQPYGGLDHRLSLQDGHVLDARLDPQRPRAWTCNEYITHCMDPVRPQYQDRKPVNNNVNLGFKRATGGVASRNGSNTTRRLGEAEPAYQKWLAGMPFSRRMRYEQQLVERGLLPMENELSERQRSGPDEWANTSKRHVYMQPSTDEFSDAHCLFDMDL